MSNNRYLVTGGAGFIGSNIVEELLNRNEKVKVIDNLSTGKRKNLESFINDIEFIEGDIRSYHIVQQAVSNIDIILHQAALPSVPRSIIDPLTTHEVNVGGTLNILEAALKSNVKRVVFASSSSVYGDNPVLPKVETMNTNPLSPYAVSKLTAEKYCQVFSSIYGLETVALRYFNVFGPKQDPSSQYSAVIPKFIEIMNKKKSPTIFGDGNQTRDFTFIRNVVEANLLAANANTDKGIVMNCACHDRISLNSLVDKINQLLGLNITAIHEKERLGDIKHSYADIEKAQKMINYRPLVDFDKGLEITLNSYIQ